ncbi:MAG: 30S ribosomal protein S2 [Candidatus Nasuia deltocephalinicola]
MLKNLLINEMLINNVHIGHKKKLLNQSMKKFIININKKIYIINLEKTLEKLLIVSKILKDIKKENKKILFLCTEKKTKDVVKTAAESINMPYVNKRWLGGSFTNFKTLRISINKMNYIREILKNKNFKMKKRKRRIYEKKLLRLESFFKGLEKLKNLPDYIFIIGLKKNKNAIKESKKMGIVSIGIVDTNNSSKNIDYIIPGNDDSFKSITFYIKKIVKIINNG